ncbi:terminase [Mycobacterium sp. SMC-4]|nr:terminase [Mycobacterium sp. SMC-4]
MTPSTPRLSEVARRLVIPEGIETSVWPRVQKRLNAAGAFFDPWQQGLAMAALGCRANGKYAVTVGGVVISIPRQVGKTYTVGGIVLGLCLEFPGSKWIWTSHHNRTTTNTFRSMSAMVKRKGIVEHLAPTTNQGIRATNGEQEIAFRNGSLIQFGAREQGFGRGLDAIDGEVFDEAQILSIRALEDMVPAANQAKHPHGGLIFYMGTPPRPIDDGEMFTVKRNKALKLIPEGESIVTAGDQMYVELAADPDADSDDQTQWRKANVSFPHRTPLESMLRLRENLPDEDSWRREALGIWPALGMSVIDYAHWLTLGSSEVEQPERAVLVVAVSQDRKWSCIAAAGDVGGKTLVMCQSLQGLSQVAGVLAELMDKRDIVELALAGDQAKALQPELVKADVEFSVLTRSDLGASCAAFQEGIKDSTVIHVGQPVLNIAVENAKTRFSGESEQWDRRDPKVDDSPLVACSAAFYLWGLKYDPNYEILESIL